MHLIPAGLAHALFIIIIIIIIIMYHCYYHCLLCGRRMQRDFLGELLEDLLEAFKTINLLKGKAKIIDARVPIIKCTLDFGQFLAYADDVTVLPDFFMFHFQNHHQMHPGLWSVSYICQQCYSLVWVLLVILS